MRMLARQVAALLANHGYRPAKLAELPELVADMAELLPMPAPSSDSALDIVLAFEPTLLVALKALGTNPRADAAHLVIGLHPDTRGRLRKHRREAAARAMGLVVESFVKHHESGIIDDLAVEIYRLTRFETGEQVS